MTAPTTSSSGPLIQSNHSTQDGNISDGNESVVSIPIDDPLPQITSQDRHLPQVIDIKRNSKKLWLVIFENGDALVNLAFRTCSICNKPMKNYSGYWNPETGLVGDRKCYHWNTSQLIPFNDDIDDSTPVEHIKIKEPPPIKKRNCCSPFSKTKAVAMYVLGLAIGCVGYIVLKELDIIKV